jgi:hypothetical protein
VGAEEAAGAGAEALAKAEAVEAAGVVNEADGGAGGFSAEEMAADAWEFMGAKGTAPATEPEDASGIEASVWVSARLRSRQLPAPRLATASTKTAAITRFSGRKRGDCRSFDRGEPHTMGAFYRPCGLMTIDGFRRSVEGGSGTVLSAAPERVNLS